MIVLTVLLTILKIIGLVLLCILGLILLLVLTVLLVPIRYYGKGEYSKDKIAGTARVTWLLHIVRFKFVYGAEQPLSFKILWFDLLNKKEKNNLKKEKKPKKEKKRKRKPEENWDDEVLPERVEAPEIQSEPIIEEAKVETAEQDKEKVKVETAEPAEKEPESETVETSEPSEEEPSAGHKKVKTEKSTQSNTKYDKIKRYIELIKSDEFKKALSLCFDSLVKILKHILPRRWQVDAELGFDSPDTLGTILGVVGMFYPIFHKHLNIYPDFEEEVLCVKGFFKGRITLLSLLIIGLKVLLNKNLRKVLKMFKEA